MAVQCRKCSWCLQNRGEDFGKRAVIEFERSSRTWLGTLTLHEQARYLFLAQTRARLDKRGVDLAKLTRQEQFVELHHEIGPRVTGYLHRVRKGLRTKGESPVRFRYLLSVEPHQDWIPHYHVLIHEVSPLTPLRKTRLKHHWPHGFSHFKLVTHEAGCHYAAKYLGKFNGGRVRTSLNYGNKVNAESATQILQDLLLKQQQILSSSIGTQKENIDPPKSPYLRAERAPSEARTARSAKGAYGD
jgi:lambda repressor-like predicted transcriptional regulator